MTLPPFSGIGSACPKCGLKSPSVRYYERDTQAPYGTKAYSMSPEVFPCIQRTCGTCGFQTLEAPLFNDDTLIAPPSSPAAQVDGDDDADPPETFI